MFTPSRSVFSRWTSGRNYNASGPAGKEIFFQVIVELILHSADTTATSFFNDGFN